MALPRHGTKKAGPLWTGLLFFGAFVLPRATGAASEPLNSDGFWSLKSSLSLKSVQRFERWTFRGTDPVSGDALAGDGISEIQHLWVGAARLEFPLAPQLSAGLDFHYSSLDSDFRINTRDLNTGQEYFSRPGGTQAMLRYGFNLRAHFSGADWNKPWGEGGSPWGPVLRPVLEIGFLTQHDAANVSPPLQKGNEFHLGCELPLASWFGLRLRGASLFGGGPGVSGPPMVLLRTAMGSEAELGFQLALPVPYFLKASDYKRNANPDGRLGLPTFDYSISRFWSGDGPFSETQHFGLTLPIRPTLSLSAGWTYLEAAPEQNQRSAAGLDSYVFEPQGAFQAGLNLYFGAVGSGLSKEAKELLRKERHALSLEARKEEAAVWPRNPDGRPSIQVSGGFVPSQRVGTASYQDYWYFQDESFSIESGQILGCKALFPLSKAFSLGIAGTYNSIQLSRSDSQGAREELAFTSKTIAFPMRFHSSGLNWELPGGRGASPWGRVWHPSFDLEPACSFSDFGPLSSPNFDAYLRTGMTLPTASWIAFCLETGYGARSPSEIYYSNGGLLFLPPGEEPWSGIGGGLGIKARLPWEGWTPLFEAKLQSATLPRDFALRWQVSAAFPLAPWLSLQLRWERTQFPRQEYHSKAEDLQAFYLEPVFSWGHKPIEEKGQKPQNQDAVTPLPKELQ